MSGHLDGEAAPLAKLTNVDVVMIRMLRPTASERMLGLWFGVGRQNINKIVERRSWRHVP